MLKNLYISLIILSASPFQCSSIDDFSKTTTIVEEPNLVKVEDNKVEFSINDDIIINTIIPDNVISNDGKKLLLSGYLAELQETISLWLYIYTDGENNDLKGVSITEADAEVGEILCEGLDYGMYISTVFDETKNTFVSRIKLKLTEPGTYYLGGGYYDSYKDNQSIRIFIRSILNEEVIINTSIKNSNEKGLYKFVVK